MNRQARTHAADAYRGALRLSHRRRWVVYIVGGVLWLSGVLWLLLHYFLMRKGDFGDVPHPLEPWLLRLHGAMAFAAMWTFGLVWGMHVVAGWRTQRLRTSGSVAVSALIGLIVTGYLLYYLGDDLSRNIASNIHWSVGLILPVLLVAHIILGRLRK